MCKHVDCSDPSGSPDTCGQLQRNRKSQNLQKVFDKFLCKSDRSRFRRRRHRREVEVQLEVLLGKYKFQTSIKMSKVEKLKKKLLFHLLEKRT